jgi:assimilatory nitrate reductase catalytic subunit
MGSISYSTTPLCPAGHLPLKGGDQPAARIAPITNGAELVLPAERVISPLEGEMSDRTEGGRSRPNIVGTQHVRR